MTGELDGKVAIITGGANGIGRATVGRFVVAGGSVVIADRDEEAGAALAAELGDAAVFHPTDVSQRADIDAAVALAVERYGRLDVMFNNAGVSGVPRRFLKDTFADFEAVMAVDLLAVLHGSQAAALQMVEQGGGGSIISTTSLAGISPGAGVTAYRAAKAGVIHLTKCLALELAEHQIRVNAIAPANIQTAINAQFDMSRTIEMTQPLARHGTAEDAADAVVFLASDRALQITGVTLPVDGGTAAGFPVQQLTQLMALRPASTPDP